MTAYNFHKRFVEPIIKGTKLQTIRPLGKSGRRHARPGEPVQLYCGMRTKSCSKIVTPDPICCQVLPVELDFSLPRSPTILLNKFPLNPATLRAFARLDGFESLDEMRLMFCSLYGVARKDMVLIRWTPPDKTRKKNSTKGRA